MKFIKSETYDKTFLEKNMMGPNCLKLLEKLAGGLDLKRGSRVLDLGCGMGLTSIFLAKEFGLNVFATDLWISASDNWQRFNEAGLEDSIVPIHAEAHELPYAAEFFDAALSIDAYNYFGFDEAYMDKCLAPLVKKGGIIAITVVGTVKEYGEVPSELKPFLTPDEFATLYPKSGWERVLSKSKLMRLDSISEFECDETWRDWFKCDSEYAVSDKKMFDAGGGKYFNFISIIGHRV